MVQNASVLHSLTCKCAWRHSGGAFFDNFSTPARQKMARTLHVFNILTCTCASGYSGVQICHSPTSQNAPKLRCFLHFDLQICFATAACHFSTSQLPKVLAECEFFSILTCKCASCHSGVPFFDIATSKNAPTMVF